MNASESSVSTPDDPHHGDALADWEEWLKLYGHEPDLDTGDTDAHPLETVSQDMDTTIASQHDVLLSGRLDMENLLYAAEQLERNIHPDDYRFRGDNVSPIHQFSVDEIRAIDGHVQIQHRTIENRLAYFHSQPSLPEVLNDPIHHQGTMQRQNWSCPTLDFFPYPLDNYSLHSMWSRNVSYSQPVMGHPGDYRPDAPPNFAISSPFITTDRPDTTHPQPGQINTTEQESISTTSKEPRKRKTPVKYAKRKSHKSEVHNNQETIYNTEDLLPYVQTLLSQRNGTEGNADYQIPERPLLPLSPYNYYYRDERDNIIHGMQTDNDPLPAPVSDFGEAKVRQLLYQHWFMDPCKPKRSHRKSHGKMNFERYVDLLWNPQSHAEWFSLTAILHFLLGKSLSKEIASRWHDLPREGRDFYRRVARIDEAYYHEQIQERKPSPRSVPPPTQTSDAKEEEEEDT